MLNICVNSEQKLILTVKKKGSVSNYIVSNVFVVSNQQTFFMIFTPYTILYLTQSRSKATVARSAYFMSVFTFLAKLQSCLFFISQYISTLGVYDQRIKKCEIRHDKKHVIQSLISLKGVKVSRCKIIIIYPHCWHHIRTCSLLVCVKTTMKCAVSDRACNSSTAQNA
jgi:hypothetical protein